MLYIQVSFPIWNSLPSVKAIFKDMHKSNVQKPCLKTVTKSLPKPGGKDVTKFGCFYEMDMILLQDPK